MELLAPAGSWESLRAAVKSGADAVYLGFGLFNARQNARNFDDDILADAIKYCHLNGVRVYVTLNTLVTDKESDDFFAAAKKANSLHVDAVLVQDIGMARGLSRAFPDLTLHASTQMSAHNLDALCLMSAAGISRAVLARELPLEQIAYISKNAPIETEVFCHGALCMCYSGQCYMSAAIGGRSGNRGKCAQPCRMTFSSNKREDKYGLSLKDLCSASLIEELKEAGVASLKIEGRMKRPEYVSVVTRAYRRAIDSGAPPSRREFNNMETIFSRDGFTDGYLKGKTGPHMFGTHKENESDKGFKELLKQEAIALNEAERAPGRVSVDMKFLADRSGRMALAVTDPDGRRAILKGQSEGRAQSDGEGFALVQSQLEKTGGTPYRVRSIETHIEPGAPLSRASVNALRRGALDELSKLRVSREKGREEPWPAPPRRLNDIAPPDITIDINDPSSLSDEVLFLAPRRIYVPLERLCERPGIIERAQGRGIELCPRLPRVIFDLEEREEIEGMLDLAQKEGIKSAMCGNLGHIKMLEERGLLIRGDMGLNIMNSHSLLRLAEWGFSSATLSFEMTLKAMGEMSKYIPCEAIVYGRLPLMICQNCIIPGHSKNCGKCQKGPAPFYDRMGEEFLVARAYPCRSEILNAHTLWLCDRLNELSRLGLFALRLNFTDEPPKRISRVMESYLVGDGTRPAKMTRGLYYKGV